MPSLLMKFVIAFEPLFSKPVFKRVKVLVMGAIVAPRSRTVTNALRVMGLSREKHFQAYHRVLSRAVWSSLRGSRILLELLRKAFINRYNILRGKFSALISPKINSLNSLDFVVDALFDGRRFRALTLVGLIDINAKSKIYF